MENTGCVMWDRINGTSSCRAIRETETSSSCRAVSLPLVPPHAEEKTRKNASKFFYSSDAAVAPVAASSRILLTRSRSSGISPARYAVTCIITILLLLLCILSTFPSPTSSIQYSPKRLWASGDNTYGTLGIADNATSFASAPQNIYLTEELRDRAIVDVSVGFGHHVLLLSSDGFVFSTGFNRYGQLGTGDFQNRFEFTPVRQGKDNVTQICVMMESSLYLTKDNVVKSTGRNQYGQLGIGEGLRKDGSAPSRNVPSTVFLGGALKNRQIQKLVCSSHTAFVLADKGLYGWGRNDFFQLGMGTQTNQYLPTLILPFKLVDVVLGKHEAYAVGENGKLYAWGRGWSGQMGLGDTVNHIVPREIPFFIGRTITNIAAGSGYVMVAVSDGDDDTQIYSFGSNSRGQLSLGPLRGDITSPHVSNTTMIGKKKIVGLRGNSYRSVAVAQDGSVFWTGEFYRFGDVPSSTQIGGGTFLDVFSPFREEPEFFQSNVTVFAADYHTFYLESFTCGSHLDQDPLVCSSHGVCTTDENICFCDAGYANNFDDTAEYECSVCPAGYFWISSNSQSVTSCEPCPVATYSTVPGATSSDICVECASGQITNGVGKNSSSDCITCSPGSYANIDRDAAISRCDLCPMGTYSSGEAQTSLESCLPCPAGRYSNSLGASGIEYCISCPAGTYSTQTGATNDSYCQQCNPGSYSNVVGANSPLSCQDCPLGHYSDASGSNNCQRCPNGTITLSTGSSSISDCIPCPVGQYVSYEMQEMQSYCVNCVKGTYANETGSSLCLLCPPGYTTEAEESTDISDCYACPPGSFSTDGYNCTLCKKGTYSPDYAQTSEETCELCPAGTYGPLLGAGSLTNCTPCAVGTYSSVLGASNVSTCLNCPTGTFSLEGSSACVACPLGSQVIVNENNVTSCIPCQKGEYIATVNGTTTCPKCPYATYTDQDSQMMCKSCPLGSITNTTGATSIDFCHTCEPGSYAVITPDFSYCELCPPGTWSDEYGASNISTCRPCRAGSYLNTEGGTSNDSCILCPAGSYNTEEGASDISQCLTCPTESYSPAGSVGCTSCPAGTVTDGPGKTSSADCLPCFVGTYSQIINGTAECIPCEQGTYSETPLATSPDTCIPCSPGTYNNQTGSDSRYSCLSCPTGRYQPNYQATSYDDCLRCPIGSYASSPGSTLCTRCPDGYTTSIVGKSSVADCQKCPPGRYSSTVMEGAYAGIKQVCLPCPAGMYSDVLGAVSNATCEYCPKGTWSNTTGAPSVSACIACGLGTYSARMGAVSNSTCLKCPQKTYADEMGSCSCKNCPFGTIPEGIGQTDVSDCRTCGAGRYLGSINETVTCIDCPAGYYSSNPAAVNESTCQPCPAGSYGEYPAAADSLSCTLCPKGTFNPYPGASSFSQCIPCPSESYSNIEGATSCTSCPNGTVTCSEGSTWPSCTNSISNTDISQCLECRDGTYFAVLEDGQKTCLRCPLGYYSSKTDSRSQYCGYTSTSQVKYGTEKCIREAPYYNIGEESCIPCGQGNFFRTPSTANWLASSRSSVCYPCPASYFSNATIAIGEGQCNDCPAGTWSSSGSSLCVDCPPGTRSTKPPGERTSRADCQACPAGYYALAQSSACSPCKPGTWSDTVAAEDDSACIPCEPGQYSSTSAATSSDTCVLCGPGEYSANYSATVCTPCAAGTANSEYGQTSCIACQSGFYSYEKSAKCTACPPGTSNAEERATSIDFCLACPEGYYAPETNSSACLPCGSGYSCPFGSSTRIASTAFSNYFQKSVVDVTQIVARTEELVQSGEIVKSSLIPLFIVGLLLMLLITIIIGCVKAGRKDPFRDLAVFDLLFNMYHPALYGKPRIKRKNKLGGLFSIIAISSSVILFLYQTSDVWLNNIQISESFQMVEPKTADDAGEVDITQGLYNASVSLFGEFETCSTDPSVENPIELTASGFLEVQYEDGETVTQQTFCERRKQWVDLKTGELHDIPNCYCEWACPHCVLDGISQSINIFAPAAHTPSIFFELGVPHYLRDPSTGDRRQFKIDGNALASTDNVFFGPQDQPVNLFFSIFHSKYLESPNVIVAIFNNTKTVSTGVTSQLLSVSNVGAVSSSERMKALRNDGSNPGVAIRYNLDVSKFVFITEEQPKQTAISYLAQLAALFGAIMSILKALLNVIEISKKKIKKHVKRFFEKLRPPPAEIPNPLDHRPEADALHENVRENIIHEADPWQYLGGHIRDTLEVDQTKEGPIQKEVKLEREFARTGKKRIQLPNLNDLKQGLSQFSPRGLSPRVLAGAINSVASPRETSQTTAVEAVEGSDKGEEHHAHGRQRRTTSFADLPKRANNYLFTESHGERTEDEGVEPVPPAAFYPEEHNLVDDDADLSAESTDDTLSDDEEQDTDISLDALSTPTDNSYETGSAQAQNPLRFIGWNSKNLTSFYDEHQRNDDKREDQQ